VTKVQTSRLVISELRACVAQLEVELQVRTSQLDVALLEVAKLKAKLGDRRPA